MKVKDILKLSADLRKTDCAKASAELCDRLQLDTSRKVEELSFGNRKKVAIVAALQHNPKLLILDEPTSGLDPLMQREFFSVLREKNEQGCPALSFHLSDNGWRKELGLYGNHVVSQSAVYCFSIFCDSAFV